MPKVRTRAGGYLYGALAGLLWVWTN